MTEPIRHLYIPVSELRELVDQSGIAQFDYDKGTKIVSKECARRLVEVGIPAQVSIDEMGVFAETGLLKQGVTGETGQQCIHFMWDPNGRHLEFDLSFLEKQ